ncbi:MAG: FAD-dependent oxidoreductase [Candidatus Omnitrophica bacterium]|nr:FAD-dependent oxidoreductase [Candidatus Omnitrophota bacterium]
MKKNRILIFGAGCTGLSAGWRLAKAGFDVTLIEKNPRPGGIGGGVVISKNIFEYGPHVFHSSDPEILHDIKSILKDELAPFERTIKIKFLGEYFDFPLTIKDIFSKLDIATVIAAGFSFLYYSLIGIIIKPKQENAETVLIRSYGKVLYNLFFKNYIEHVWGIEPKYFSADFAHQRIPKLDILKFLEVITSKIKIKTHKKIKTDNFVEKVEGELYCTRKGFSGITDKISQQITELGGNIYFEATVKNIVYENGRIKSVTYNKDGKDYREEADAIISTIPINQMVDMLSPKAPEHVIKAADGLKYRALVFVGVLVARPRVLPASFMYFRELSFNRITDIGYFGVDISVPNSTILIAEICCDKKDAYWADDEKAKNIVLDELIRENLINKSDVLECHVYRLEHAYPMYVLDYKDNLNIIYDFIRSIPNLKSVGRQGGFNYINSHVAMRIGYDTADSVIKLLKE